MSLYFYLSRFTTTSIHYFVALHDAMVMKSVWTAITSLGCNGQLKRCFHPNVKDTDLNRLSGTEGACGSVMHSSTHWSLTNCNDKDVNFACQMKISNNESYPFIAETRKKVFISLSRYMNFKAEVFFFQTVDPCKFPVCENTDYEADVNILFYIFMV
jgi:hypothetical protein